jgi:hypothetical protein
MVDDLLGSFHDGIARNPNGPMIEDPDDPVGP